MSTPSSSLSPQKGSASSTPDSTNSSASSHNTNLPSLLASHNNYPRIPWLQESWFRTSNRYERIATGSPLTSIGLLSQGLVQHHINLLPTLDSVADFLAVYNEHGRYLGSRPKLTTWPPTKRDVEKNKVWSV